MGDFKLKAHVHAVEVDSAGKQTGRAQTFGPDDDLSSSENEWALAAISNPDVWDGDAPTRREPPAALTAEDEEKARMRARIAELEAELAAGSAGSTGSTAQAERPGGADSREKWAAYAKAQGAPEHELVPVDEGGLSRDRLREKYGS
jgi:hypothetical protein